MTLSVASDPERVGHALLTIPGRPAGPLALSIGFEDGSFLGPDGRRTRARHLFEAAPRAAPGTYALGPAVTAHVPEAETVTLADRDGTVLGTLAWDGIRPPPEASPGARIAGGPRTISDAALRLRVGAPAPSVEVEVEVESEPEAPQPVAPASRATGPSRERRRVARAAVGLVLVLFLMLAGAAALVLSGWAGWTLDDATLAFSGPAGGPFRPDEATAHLLARPAAGILARFVSYPFVTAGAPPWLDLRQDGVAGAWTLHVAARGAEAPVPGRQTVRVPLAFPLGGTAAGLAVTVTLDVEPPPVPPPPAPAALPPPPAPTPAPGPDDAACDAAAASPFDSDRPAGHGAAAEIFDLSPDAIARGLAACDPRLDRAGPGRRLIVQRGRLLAGRALQRAAAGDVSGARADMDEALADWRAGSVAGSGTADNLIGAYHAGTFDRPGADFTPPDEAAATADWARGAARGNPLAERNYAAQLLAGRGTRPDPLRAVALLRDALARGDERAAGVLGVALYTGFPPGIVPDRAEGWALVRRAQCVDRAAGVLLAQEIARGAEPAADRRSCP